MWTVLITASKSNKYIYLYAVGNNDEAARRAGINVGLIKMAAFYIAGRGEANAGVLDASRTLGIGEFSGSGVGGGTLVLESIAASVIGGVSLLVDVVQFMVLCSVHR